MTQQIEQFIKRRFSKVNSFFSRKCMPVSIWAGWLRWTASLRLLEKASNSLKNPGIPGTRGKIPGPGKPAIFPGLVWLHFSIPVPAGQKKHKSISTMVVVSCQPWQRDRRSNNRGYLTK